MRERLIFTVKRRYLRPDNKRQKTQFPVWHKARRLLIDGVNKYKVAAHAGPDFEHELNLAITDACLSPCHLYLASFLRITDLGTVNLVSFSSVRRSSYQPTLLRVNSWLLLAGWRAVKRQMNTVSLHHAAALYLRT